MDNHFKGILFPEVYKNLPSTKIAYPGLWIIERNTAAAGILPDRASAPDSGFSAIYGWVDIENDPGAAGIWVGNFNWGSELMTYNVGYDSVYYMDANRFSLRGAAWVTPLRSKAFRGLSVTVDIDNIYAYDGNEYMEALDKRTVYVNLATLIKISGDYHLRVGARTYNKQSEDPLDTRFDNSKLYSDGIFAGLVDDERRTLELRIDNIYGALYSGEKSDTLSFALRYTQGAARSYMRHLIFWGLAADFGMAFGSKIDDEVGTFEYGEYFKNLTGKGSVLHASVSAPIALDASIYGPLRVMLSVAPRVGFTRVAHKYYPQHKLAFNLPYPELSLRGAMGKMFDFTLKPTVSNDVFMTALEIRYKF
jgi:hypothetical protein